MKKLISLALCMLSLLSAQVFSQTAANGNLKSAPFPPENFQKLAGGGHLTNTHSPSPLSVPILIPGTVPLGLVDMYQQQFAGRGLHNIIVDPDHPKNLHAAITFAKNVTEADTFPGNAFMPQLRVYYSFSADDGATWSTPKPIDTARTSNHEMILIKRGEDWVPAIAAVRNVADTNTPYYCSLYLEQGNPGDGNFKEFRTDRKTFRDSLRNIDFPSIAVSHDGTKIFMTAGIDNNNNKNPQYIQFGTFTLSSGGKSATWGGWKPGPSVGTKGNENPVGFAYAGSTSVRVSPKGKVGVVWLNRDFQTPDISTYLSESNDEGATWLETPKNVVSNIASTTASYFISCFHSDFWYADETAHCALDGFYYNRDSTAGFYIPASGCLLYWSDGMSAPVMVLAKGDDNDLGASIVDGSWLASWTNAAGSPDPQGLATVNFPTVARSSDPHVFSIYFSAWQDGDIQDMTDFGQIGTGMFTSYPYFGIWQVTTTDDGASFSQPVLVRGNDLSSSAQLYDFRQVETAPWNPGSGGFLNVHTIYNVDTMAGVESYGGDPGFDQVTWLFEKEQLAGVHGQNGNTGSPVENYPNPFATKTTISFVLAQTAPVSLRITDLLGNEVTEVHYGIFGAGPHEVIYDASRLGPGSYPYIITTGDQHSTGVLNVLK